MPGQKHEARNPKFETTPESEAANDSAQTERLKWSPAQAFAQRSDLPFFVLVSDFEFRISCFRFRFLTVG